MMTAMKDGPSSWPELPFDPTPEVFEHTVVPVPVVDRALEGPRLVAEGFRAASFELAVAVRRTRRQQRFQWVVAGLAGAAVALLWRKGLDRG